MKKKILLGLVTLSIAVFAWSNSIQTQGTLTTSNVNLESVIKDANAACVENSYGWNNGRCSTLSGNCYWSTDLEECDWTRS